MDPDALRELIVGCKNIKLSSGGEKQPVSEEEPTIAFAFASVVTTRAISAGEILTKNNIWVKRPGGGDFAARDFNMLLGRKVCRDIPHNIQLLSEHLVQLSED